jgi:hypothetical protein
MIDQASFNSQVFEMEKLLETTYVNILLHLTDPRESADDCYPISGFPRQIILDELPECTFKN